MERFLPVAILAIPCLILPVRYLIFLSILGVGLADSKLVPLDYVYYLRFMPMGILCFRVVSDLKKKRFLRQNSFSLLKSWLPFWAFSIISIAYSLEPLLSIQRVISAGFIILGFGIGIPLYFGNSKKMVAVLTLLTLVLGVGTLYSLCLAPGHKSIPAGDVDYERLYGIFKNPNTLGLLAMQLIFVLIYFWQREKNQISRKMLFVAAVAAGAAIAASGSRASALGFSIGLLTFIFANAKIQRSPLPSIQTVLVILFSIFMVVGFFFQEYSGGVFRTDTSSRMVVWERTWNLYQENAPLGVGFGGSDELIEKDALELHKKGIYAAGPHNSFLRLLLETGFIGVGLSLFAFTFIILRSWKYLLFLEDPKLGVVLLAVISASLVNSVFEEWVFGFGNSGAVPFWLFLGMLSQLTDEGSLRIKYWNQFRARRAFMARIQDKIPNVSVK